MEIKLRLFVQRASVNVPPLCPKVQLTRVGQHNLNATVSREYRIGHSKYNALCNARFSKILLTFFDLLRNCIKIAHAGPEQDCSFIVFNDALCHELSIKRAIEMIRSISRSFVQTVRVLSLLKLLSTAVTELKVKLMLTKAEKAEKAN